MTNVNRDAKVALAVWVGFLLLVILINATIPFALGTDVRAWTYSTTKDVLFHLFFYGAIFLALPLILVKGWTCVRQPRFLMPLLIALLAIVVRPFFRPSVALVIPVLAYLHAKFDLSELGFRGSSWKWEGTAILILGLVVALTRLFRTAPFELNLYQASLTLLDRLLANPATTTEILFYFGFLAERISRQYGNLWTPLLIGMMYTTHEMSNPEYWYGSMSFPVVFVGLVLFTVIYLWRRNIIVLWLGDGLGRFLTRLA